MVFDTRTLEMINYTRKVWAPFALAQTRAATMETACTRTSQLRRAPRRTPIVLFEEWEYADQRADFAYAHHTSDCPCDICTYDRQMRAESYELEYEVGLAAHYEAEAMLEDERRRNEEEGGLDRYEFTNDGNFSISAEDWAEIKARNEERGTAFGWWY